MGAGIAGLALARALTRHGIACTVVERRDAESGRGMGLNLPGNAVRALAALGVAEDVLAAGVPIRRREYRNDRDRLLFAVDEAAFWDGVGASVCVRHGRVQHALLSDATVADAVRYDSAVTRLLSSDDQVRVDFVATEDSSTFDLVVGADGVHSVVRPAVTPFTVRPSIMTAGSWRFITENPGIDGWTAWTGSGATFLLIPVAEGQVYGYAAGRPGTAPGDDPGWLDAAFARFPAPVTTTVSRVVDDPAAGLFHSPVHEVRCERWSSGRVVLIGEAAHAMGPVWAQGAAMALEDALVLADLLAHRTDWSRVGSEFEARRRPRVEHVRAATDKMSRLAGLPSPIRNLVGPFLGPRGYREAYGPLRAAH